MSIKKMNTDTLRTMEGKEALILRGCGGDLQEWVDGINDVLTERGILKNGSRIENCTTFQYDGLTCLLFPFEGADLDVGKLAMWRLATLEDFHGIWRPILWTTTSAALQQKNRLQNRKSRIVR